MQNELPNILLGYRTYKARIPVYGAILLDTSMERVLLVSPDVRLHTAPHVMLCM